MNKIISTWIIFHGITDIFLPIHIWLPFYLLSPLYIVLPNKLLYLITFIKSIIHFKNDYIFDIKYIFFGLLFLLYYGKYKISQNILIFYMSLIHVPIHIYKFNPNNHKILYLIGFYIIFYNINYLHKKIGKIIENGGKITDNIDKLLLGIVNAHIWCNLCIN